MKQTIKQRLTRIEALAETSDFDSDPFLVYSLGLIEAVYSAENETQRQEAISALGECPEPTTEGGRQIVRALEIGYASQTEAVRYDRTNP